MSEIVQLYKDEQKTIKVYPKTLASEVYVDENTTFGEQLEQVSFISPSGNDDTNLLQSILSNKKILRLGKGTFKVSSLTLDDNAKIITCGYETVIKQIEGTPIGTRILNIIGDNVSVDELVIEGNIATETGEHRHAIQIYNTDKSNMNISIKGLKAINIRGDGLCISGNANYNPKNIEIGNVYTQNCVRNGVSITGGRNIYIKNIISLNSGVIGVDLESDTVGGAIKNIRIDNVITSNMGILASGGTYPWCENINIGNVCLRANFMNSTPDYPNSLNTDGDGLTIRNSRYVTIESLDIDGFNRHAINFLISGNDRYSDKIKINNLKMTNCSLTDTTYNCYIQLAGCNTCEINNIDSTTQTGKIMVKGTSKTANEQNITMNNVNHVGGVLCYLCGCTATNVKCVSDSNVFTSLKAFSSFRNCELTGVNISGYSDNVILEGNKITYTSNKDVGGANIYKNNLINTVFTS